METQSKAAFVRSFPKNTPAAEIVKAAKEKGIGKISPAYVYVTRSKDAGKAATKPKKVKAPVKANGNGRKVYTAPKVEQTAPWLPHQPESVRAIPTDEEEFRNIIKRIGTVRAAELFHEAVS